MQQQTVLKGKTLLCLISTWFHAY